VAELGQGEFINVYCTCRGWLGLVVALCAATGGGFTIDTWTSSHLTREGVEVGPSPAVVESGGVWSLWTQGFESDIALVSIFQMVTFPDRAAYLSFDASFETEGGDTGDGTDREFPDFVVLSFLDDSSPALDRALIGIDRDGPYDAATLEPVSGEVLPSGWLRFSREIAPLSGRSGVLYWDLSDQDDNSFSTARVRNVRIDAIPEPSALVLFAGGLGSLAAAGRRRGRRRRA